MKRIILVCLMSFLLIGCSSDKSENQDVLSELTDFNFTQSFDLKEEKTVMINVEIYENGKLKGEPLMYFGNHFNGKGNIQFSYFRPNYTMSKTDLMESFIVASIQDDEQTASYKMLENSRYVSYLFKTGKESVITKEGDYIIGAFAYLTEESASSSFPQIQIEERQEFIEAYKSYPLAYLVSIEVR